MTDDDSPKVVDFRTRKAPVGVPDKSPSPVPADGLVLACACGSTLHELRNAGYVVCSRCGAYGHATWRFAPRVPEPGGKQPRGTPA